MDLPIWRRAWRTTPSTSWFASRSAKITRRWPPCVVRHCRPLACGLRKGPPRDGLLSPTGGNLMRGHAANGLSTLTLLSALATLVACGGGSAPELEDVGDQVVAVGSELVLQLRATDADGDTLAYGFSSDVPDLGDRATVSRTPSGDGTFRWRPVAADVGEWHFDFTVSDGDNTATLPVVIEVR